MMGGLQLLRAFVRRDWMTARSYRFGFAMQLVDILLYLVMFFFLGRIVDASAIARADHLPTHGYFSFAVVGLMLFEVMHVGLNSFAAKVRQDQTTGTLEALFVTPAPHGFIVLAGAAYDLIRAACLSLLFLLVGVTAFGVDLSIHLSSLLILSVAIPAALTFFCAMGVAVAAATVLFKQTAVLVGFVTTALALLGGVYFPVDVMPRGLRLLAEISPVTWALDASRAALLGGRTPIGQLIMLVLVAVVALPISMLVFAWCLRRAKRAGSLTQY